MNKLPITRENFVRYIDSIKRVNKIDREINKIFWDNKCDSDFFSPDFSLSSELTEVLDIVMHKPDDWCDDVSYFVHELECGATYKPGSVVENGEDIDFSNADTVYTYLERRYNE